MYRNSGNPCEFLFAEKYDLLESVAENPTRSFDNYATAGILDGEISKLFPGPAPSEAPGES
jgi:hypothetical protein